MGLILAQQFFRGVGGYRTNHQYQKYPIPLWYNNFFDTVLQLKEAFNLQQPASPFLAAFSALYPYSHHHREKTA